MTQASDEARDLADAMAAPWADEKEDRDVLRRIFHEEGARLQLAFSDEKPDPDRPGGTIRQWAVHGPSYEPLHLAWTDFFMKKYPGRQGFLLFTKFWNSVKITHDPDRGFVLKEMFRSSLMGA